VKNSPAAPIYQLKVTLAEPEYEVADERKVTLREAAPVACSRFGSLYDLGDSWTHEVVVEKIEPPDPQFRSAIPGIRSTRISWRGRVGSSTPRHSI
jgi:hypothetical protein